MVARPGSGSRRWVPDGALAVPGSRYPGRGAPHGVGSPERALAPYKVSVRKG